VDAPLHHRDRAAAAREAGRVGDEVGPGIAHLGDDGQVELAAEPVAGVDRLDGGGRGDDDVGADAALLDELRGAASGRGGGRRVVEGARDDIAAVRQPVTAEDLDAVLSRRVAAGAVGAAVVFRELARRVVRRRRDHRDLVPALDELARERAPASLRGTVFGGEIVGQQ
jgi:hypothetical protein